MSKFDPDTFLQELRELSDTDSEDEGLVSILEANKDREAGQLYEQMEKDVLTGKDSEFLRYYYYEALRKVASYLKIPYRSQMTTKAEYSEAIYGYIALKHKTQLIKKKPKI